jgi:hypothetical protein
MFYRLFRPLLYPLVHVQGKRESWREKKERIEVARYPYHGLPLHYAREKEGYAGVACRLLPSRAGARSHPVVLGSSTSHLIRLASSATRGVRLEQARGEASL